MSDVKWIKIYVDMFDNKKIRFIRSLPEGNDILLFWIMLLSSAGKCNANGFIILTENIPYTLEMLANEYSLPLSTVQLAIQTLKNLNMVNDEDGAFCITAWGEYQNIESMDKIREQTKVRMRGYRERKKALPPCNVTVTSPLRKVTRLELDKELDIDKEVDIDIYAHFDEFWQAYPRKLAKKDAVKAWEKIKPDEQLLIRILNAIEKTKKSQGWIKDGGSFIPYPATWLNGRRWEDETETAALPIRKEDDNAKHLPGYKPKGPAPKSEYDNFEL